MARSLSQCRHSRRHSRRPWHGGSMVAAATAARAEWRMLLLFAMLMVSDHPTGTGISTTMAFAMERRPASLAAAAAAAAGTTYTAPTTSTTITGMYRRRRRHRSQPRQLFAEQRRRLLLVRGGTASGEEDGSDNDTPRTKQQQQQQQRGMSLALAACYFTVMGAKCALPATLSLLTSPNIGLTFATVTTATPAASAAASALSSISSSSSSSSSSSRAMARHLTSSTLAIALGKLVLGPVIDTLGGTVSLQITLLLLTLLLGTIAVGQSFVTFAVAWMGIDFLFSSCWAACLHTIHDVYPPSDWPAQIGRLAAAARAGNSVALAVFAAILSHSQRQQQQGAMHWFRHQYWRPVFGVAALAQLVPLVLLRVYGHQARHTKRSHHQDVTSNVTPPPTTTSTSSWSIVRRQAQTVDFWLHLVSRSALMVFASFLLFVPTLMTNIYHTTASTGARVGSLYALGCFVAVTTMSQAFAELSVPSKTATTTTSKPNNCQQQRWKKLLAVTLFLLVGATGSSALQWAHVSGWIHLSPLASALLLGLWGFSFAIPFYLPPSLYAMSKGGAESAATLADVLDIAGFGLLAWFNGYVAGIAHADPRAWRTPFAVTTTCALVSFVALGTAVWRETTATPATATP